MLTEIARSTYPHVDYFHGKFIRVAFPDSKMPGLSKANLSVSQAQVLLPKFAPVSVNELLTSSNLPRLNRVTSQTFTLASMLEKSSLQNPEKNVSNLRKIDIEKNHRFVFGKPGSSTVLAIFSPNSEETRRLFRYHSALKPSSQVEVINLRWKERSAAEDRLSFARRNR